ncbi:toxin-antitoxin system, toxin component [Kribbella sp. NPDC004875]|uniref:LppU/SCO3897 family protein n=1 Tax=Kribbella sp. NPDC004875 TaxID=3364107 RepID=UPI0036811820
MTTSPPQPPQNPYSGQPAGYGPPQQQPFPQYTQQPGQQDQPSQQGQPGQQQYGGQPYQQPFGEQHPGQHGQHGQPEQPGQQYGQQSYQQRPQDQYQQAPQYAGQQAQGQYQHGATFPGQGPQGQPHGQQAFAPQGQMVCRFCGGYPAVEATVRGHQGLIILMRFLKLQGPFCRTCGMASVRDMTSKSLWQGWWGIGSSIINPITMLMNIGPMQKFKSLPEPQPGPGRPMDPGKPLFKRPAILMLLLPIAFIALLVIGNLNSTESKAQIGACVVNKGTSSSPDVKVVDCTSSEAEYKIVDKIDDSTDDSQCGDDAEASYVYQHRSTKYTLCLTPVR